MEPFIGEIKLLPWYWAPKGWAQCNGQLLPIQQNTALFSLLGTMYGGNGQTNFGLPNLQGRVAMHRDPANYPQGEMSGEENETLSLSEMAMHNHGFVGTSTVATLKPPLNNVLGASSTTAPFYATDAVPQTLNPTSISTAGGGQPHNNMQPYLTMNYCIALVGVYPSRN